MILLITIFFRLFIDYFFDAADAAAYLFALLPADYFDAYLPLSCFYFSSPFRHARH